MGILQHTLTPTLSRKRERVPSEMCPIRRILASSWRGLARRSGTFCAALGKTCRAECGAPPLCRSCSGNTMTPLWFCAAPKDLMSVTYRAMVRVVSRSNAGEAVIHLLRVLRERASADALYLQANFYHE